MDSLNTIKSHVPELKSRFGVKKIGVFGSFSRGEQNETSDVDVLVGFEKPVDIFTFLELKEYLESILRTKVDLVTEKALKPMIRGQILSEVSYL